MLRRPAMRDGVSLSRLKVFCSMTSCHSRQTGATRAQFPSCVIAFKIISRISGARDSQNVLSAVIAEEPRCPDVMDSFDGDICCSERWQSEVYKKVQALNAYNYSHWKPLLLPTYLGGKLLLPMATRSEAGKALPSAA